MQPLIDAAKAFLASLTDLPSADVNSAGTSPLYQLSGDHQLAHFGGVSADLQQFGGAVETVDLRLAHRAATVAAFVGCYASSISRALQRS